MDPAFILRGSDPLLHSGASEECLKSASLIPVDQSLADIIPLAVRREYLYSSIDLAGLKPLASLCKKLPFGDLLLREDPLSLAELATLKDQLIASFSYTEEGVLLPAPGTFHRHVDIFEQSVAALARESVGDRESAARIASSLAHFYARPQERDRFMAFLLDPDDPRGKYCHPEQLAHPRIAADLTQQGSLTECPAPRDEDRLASVAGWLAMTFRLANNGTLNLKELDGAISAAVNDNNKVESIFVVGLKFLNRVEYWDHYIYDRGPLGQYRGSQRASSIGIALSALYEAARYFEREGWEALPSARADHERMLNAELQYGLEKGAEALHHRVGDGTTPPRETQTSAIALDLVFLLAPFRAGLSPAQENAVLAALCKDRLGEVGFTLADFDAMRGADYVDDPEKGTIPPYTSSAALLGSTDAELHGRRNAEYTLGAPLIASALFERVVASAGHDHDSYRLADRFCKFALGLVTSGDSLEMSFSGKNFKIAPGRMPQAYWFDSRERQWRANDITPHIMSESTVLIMLAKGCEAAALIEGARTLSNFPAALDQSVSPGLS